MIIPGILETSFEEIKNKIALMENLVEVVQIDVADGVLVDGKTFIDMEKLAEIDSEVQVELHLMVKDPANYVIPMGCLTKIEAHIEAEGIDDFISKSRELGMKVGLSINPGTETSKLDPYLDKIDFVQFMTVVPGGQGRQFEDKVLKQIVLFKQQHPEMKIQTDGGTGFKNLQKVVDAGVDDIVIGSTIFSSEDPVETLEELQSEEEKLRK